MRYEYKYLSENGIKRKEIEELLSPISTFEKKLRTHFLLKCSLIFFAVFMVSSTSFKFAFNNRLISRNVDRKEINTTAISDRILFTPFTFIRDLIILIPSLKG